MKQKVNIDKYVGKDGKYIISMNKTFKQAFSALELKHINMMLRINRINGMCLEYTRIWKKEKTKWNNANYEFAFLQEEIILPDIQENPIRQISLSNEVRVSYRLILHYLYYFLH